MPKHTQNAVLRYKVGNKKVEVPFKIHRSGPGWGNLGKQLSTRTRSQYLRQTR